MRKALIFSVLGLIGLTSIASHKKKAETIGDYLGSGLQGVTFDLPDGKVLKIMDLNTIENKYMATFLNYYAVKTANGELAPSKHLPTIYYFDAGYANRMMIEEIEEELSKNYHDSIIEYNTPVAMWIMDKYDKPNAVLNSNYDIKEDLDEARRNLSAYFIENNLGIIDDLHEENYGFDDKGNIVFFDFDVIITDRLIHEVRKM
tara:strand:+ start:1800 stop:2408 length:609 start_codon:yes stop_codon:yes gene_type:complete